MLWRRQKSLAPAGLVPLCLIYSACTVVTIFVCVEVVNMLCTMFSEPMVWFVLKIQRVVAGHGQLKSGGTPEEGLASMFDKVTKGLEQAHVNTGMRMLVP